VYDKKVSFRCGFGKCLIQNAQYALFSREVKQPVIVVTIDKNRISIQDNGGGIDDEIIN